MLLPTEKLTVPRECSDGMTAIQKDIIHPGTMLHRFSSRRLPPHLRIASAWWIRDSDYQLLVRKNAGSKMTLGFGARFALAIRQSWGNDCDIVVSAYVGQLLHGYCGYGKAQRGDIGPNGIHIIYGGDLHIRQLYIPGLVQADRTPTELAIRSLLMVRTTPISSYQLPGVTDENRK